MLTASDIAVAKLLVQLRLASPAELVPELRALETDPFSPGDLLAALQTKGKLSPESGATVRDHLGRFRAARDEASYVHVLEQENLVAKDQVQRFLGAIERSPVAARLGAVLVEAGLLTVPQDHHVLRRRRRRTLREDASIVERYRGENFSGIARPLAPTLEPASFRASVILGVTIPVEPATPVLESWILAASKKPEPTHEELAAEKEKKKASVDDVRALKRIADHTIVETLGAGGAGAVFLGQKDGVGEFAAIKVLLDSAASEAQRGRFAREVRVMKRLKHQNVIRLLDSGTTDQGITYLIVPALVGKDLGKLLAARQGEGLAPALTARIMEQVLDGLSAVHDAGIVHRDMKPQNVYVLAGQQEIRILDFGLAKFLDEKENARIFATTEGEILGTPAYIAPELVSTGKKVDGRADIYSAAVLFFELLTGKRPFDSDTVQGYLRQHLAFPPPTLAETKPDRSWPPSLDALLQKMLAKSPEERPASCRTVLEELRGGLLAQIAAMPAPAAPAEAPEAKQWGDHGLVAKLE